MDLRSYCLLFPQAANRYILRNIDSKSTWTSGATSFLFLRFLMDRRMNIDSKSYMDLRSYFPLFPQASNRYIKRNIDSEPYIDLRSYFLLFPQASNRHIRRNVHRKSYMDLRSYFLPSPQASNGYMKRNIYSKSYMDLRSYCLLFPQAANRYILKIIDSRSTWTSGATSFYFLRLQMYIRRNIESKSYMDLRSYCLLFPQIYTKEYRQ